MKKYNFQFILNGEKYRANFEAESFKDALKLKKEMKNKFSKSNGHYKQVGRLEITSELYLSLIRLPKVL